MVHSAIHRSNFSRTPLVVAVLSTLLFSPAFAVESFLPESSLFVGYEAKVPMRDGKFLAADVYVPKAGGKCPVVLIQTPYNKALTRAWFEDPKVTPRGPLFADTNYAFVIVDWRARFASMDAAAPGVQAGNGQDGFDAVAWVVQQDFCNGKVGTWGPSALGAVQFRTASQQPPNLVCSVPMVMPLNLEYHMYFHGGVMWEEFVKRLGTLGWDLYGQLKQHPTHDTYWRVLERTNFLKPGDMRVPMLLVGGWYDIYTDYVLDTFDAIRKNGGEKARKHSRLIMGPWVHRTGLEENGALTFPGTLHYDNRQAQAFFDYWLRGVDNGFDEKTAAITYYQMGANEWRETDTWPPAGVRETTYYLHGEGGMSEGKPMVRESFSAYQYDPANPAPTFGGHVLTQELAPGPQDQRERVEPRKDVIAFTTEALGEDLEVAGKLKVRVFVATDRKDTDFAAIVTDVYPDGRSMLVTEGIQRLRFRDGTERETLAEPGKVYPITIELTNTALTFLKGHRIRVLITSSNYPKYAKNLNDGGEMYVEGVGVAANNRIYHDAERPSALILPIHAD